MKKLLLSILIILLMALLIYVGISGFSIGKIEVLGIQGMQQKNDELDSKISEATRLASTDFAKKTSEVQASTKKLAQEKQEYEDMASVSTGEQVEIASQYDKYEVEYLWTKIGNHATSEGVEIKIDIVAGTGESTYDLNFTVNGSYIGISDFISSIENDSSLGFKIEGFSMTPGADANSLQATFTCKNIIIENVQKSTTTDKTAKNAQQDGNTTDENATANSTNTTSGTSNTANTTSSNSSTATNTTNSTNTAR